MGAPSPRCTAEFKQKAVELYKKVRDDLRGGGARAGLRRRGPVRLGQEGRRGRLRAGDDPFQMAEDLRGLKRENERLKRGDEMLLKASALFAGRQLWESRRRGRSSSSFSPAKAGGRSRRCAPRPGRPAGVTMRGRAGRTRCATGGLAGLITRVRSEVRGIYGASEALFALRRMGVRTSMRRAARIMRERGWRGVTRACAKRPSGEKRSQAGGVGRRPGLFLIA